MLKPRAQPYLFIVKAFEEKYLIYSNSNIMPISNHIIGIQSSRCWAILSVTYYIGTLQLFSLCSNIQFGYFFQVSGAYSVRTFDRRIRIFMGESNRIFNIWENYRKSPSYGNI